ncbi:MAG: hypothetical protein CVT66_04525 [Actinobacteria bacterium HGW-Actinobacteria-6]|nr:MAG: hypothetical protein CVT66_04525 [Actinobacteria bacterium HGW-Actinobacteria-6]
MLLAGVMLLPATALGEAVYSSDECVSCHPQARSAHPATDDDASCFTCHPWEDSAVPGPFPMPHDGDGGSHDGDWVSGTTQCNECHDGAYPFSHGPYGFTSITIFDSVDCNSCHASGMLNVFQAGASHSVARMSWGLMDYYSWGAVGQDGAVLGSVGANPTNPGVHANYQTTTAKCGICHSVHRARANGVKLLDATVATCSGCHAAGTGTVTSKLISWESGGPHHSGTLADCATRSCHASSPHGAGASQYKIVAAKLLSSNADSVLAAAVASSSVSGITVADLNADVASTWTEATRSAVRTGYTCNQDGCHVQTLLAVVKKGYAEEREGVYGSGDMYNKTGHMSSAAATSGAGSYVAVTGCVSCHDQTDDGVTSGYTFPHSETAYGTSSNTSGRAYLWMTRASYAGAADTTGLASSLEKAMDGTCLKCHRDSTGLLGIGLTR